MKTRTVLTALPAGLWLSFAAPLMAADKAAERLAELVSMTPDMFQFRTALQDDDLEEVAVFSTRPGFANPSGADIYLRAFVYKASGRTEFQVVFKSPNLRASPRFFQVNMAGPEGLLTSKTVLIDNDVNCLRYGCYHAEIVGADLPDTWTRWAAASYVANTHNPINFRIKSMSGLDQDIQVMPAEIAGLLLAVDAYKARKATAK